MSIEMNQLNCQSDRIKDYFKRTETYLADLGIQNDSPNLGFVRVNRKLKLAVLQGSNWIPWDQLNRFELVNALTLLPSLVENINSQKEALIIKYQQVNGFMSELDRLLK